MASQAHSRLIAAYRTRLAAVRADVTGQLEALYRNTIDPADLDASFDRFIARAVPLVASGQAASARLAAAFIRADSLARTGELIDIVPGEDIVGVTMHGQSLAEGMAAFSAMVRAKIEDGA